MSQVNFLVDFFGPFSLERTGGKNPTAKFNRSCVNREVQTVNWEAGKEGAAETGVKMGPEKGAYTVN